MTDILQKKIEDMAEHYVDMVDKRIQQSMNAGGEIYFDKINDGIRTIHHLTGALQKLIVCKKPTLSDRDDRAGTTGLKERGRTKKNDDWIEKQNTKIIHWLCVFFVSMITALLTTFALTM